MPTDLEELTAALKREKEYSAMLLRIIQRMLRENDKLREEKP